MEGGGGWSRSSCFILTHNTTHTSHKTILSQTTPHTHTHTHTHTRIHSHQRDAPCEAGREGNSVQGGKGRAVVQYGHGQVPRQVGGARIKIQIFCDLHLDAKERSGPGHIVVPILGETRGGSLRACPLGKQFHPLYRDDFCELF